MVQHSHFVQPQRQILQHQLSLADVKYLSTLPVPYEHDINSAFFDDCVSSILLLVEADLITEE